MPSSLALILDPNVEYFLSLTTGGGDGIYREVGSEGEVVAQDPVALKVDVGTMCGWVSNRMARIFSTTESDSVAAPTGGGAGDLRRIDRVQFTVGEGVNIVTGSESATPSAPALESDSMSLALIYCRNGMTSIKDADDSSNGYIVDDRSYL